MDSENDNRPQNSLPTGASGYYFFSGKDRLEKIARVVSTGGIDRILSASLDQLEKIWLNDNGQYGEKKGPADNRPEDDPRWQDDFTKTLAEVYNLIHAIPVNGIAYRDALLYQADALIAGLYFIGIGHGFDEQAFKKNLASDDTYIADVLKGTQARPPLRGKSSPKPPVV